MDDKEDYEEEVDEEEIEESEGSAETESEVGDESEYTDSDILDENIDDTNEDINEDADTNNEQEEKISTDTIMEESEFIKKIGDGIIDIKKIIPENEHITRRIMTQAEVSSILSIRASQLQKGVNPVIPIEEGMTAYQIAVEEFKRRLIPLIILRKVGNRYEKLYIKQMSTQIRGELDM